MATAKEKAAPKAAHTHQLGDACLSHPVSASADPFHVSYFCAVTGERADFSTNPDPS